MILLEDAVKEGNRERIHSLQNRYNNLSQALSSISRQLGDRILL
jgi:hypothetical protein